MKTKSPLVAVDFFCGAGGMTQGLKQAGVNVVAGVDSDERVRATYEANHGKHFVGKDIRNVRADDVQEWVRRANGSAENLVLVGCSPCQFWSRVPTNKTASRDGSTLLLAFGDLVQSVNPAYVVVENVPGLSKLGRDAVLSPFVELLDRSGYAVASGVVSSAWFGVPQRRERFLLVASRLHDEVSLPPYNEALAPPVEDFIGEHNGFKPIPAGGLDASDPWHRASALAWQNLARLRLTPADGGDRSGWRETDLQIPTYEGRDGHFRNVYGRMWWSKPASTLTTRFNSVSNGRFAHPDEDRAISVREGSVLQTFPRDYKFSGAMRNVCRQIGNAVPPLMARALGQRLLSLHEEATARRANRLAG